MWKQNRGNVRGACERRRERERDGEKDAEKKRKRNGDIWNEDGRDLSVTRGKSLTYTHTFVILHFHICHTEIFYTPPTQITFRPNNSGIEERDKLM